MDSVIKIIGAIIAFIAIVSLLKPTVMKHIMVFFSKGKRLYIAGLIRFALAVAFLLGARECDLPWVIGIIGVVFIISGLLIFTLGLKRIKSILNWYQTQPILILRVIAVIVLIFAAIIIYAA